MTTFIAGEPIAEQFALSSGKTGETFTVSNATKPGGSWAGPVVTEVGSGVYQAAGSTSGTESATGFYRATLTGNTTGQVFTLVWQVLAAPSARYSRRSSGVVIAANDINELQVDLERILHVLDMD